MTTIKIKHDPELSKESLMELFSGYFQEKYDVYPTLIIGADFIVKKSAKSGVFVKLKQKEGETKVIYGSIAPSVAVRVLYSKIPLVGGMLMAHFAGSDVMQDVKNYLETMKDDLTLCPA